MLKAAVPTLRRFVSSSIHFRSSDQSPFNHVSLHVFNGCFCCSFLKLWPLPSLYIKREVKADATQLALDCPAISALLNAELTADRFRFCAFMCSSSWSCQICAETPQSVLAATPNPLSSGIADARGKKRTQLQIPRHRSRGSSHLIVSYLLCCS